MQLSFQIYQTQPNKFPREQNETVKRLVEKLTYKCGCVPRNVHANKNASSGSFFSEKLLLSSSKKSGWLYNLGLATNAVKMGGGKCMSHSGSRDWTMEDVLGLLLFQTNFVSNKRVTRTVQWPFDNLCLGGFGWHSLIDWSLDEPTKIRSVFTEIKFVDETVV